MKKLILSAILLGSTIAHADSALIIIDESLNKVLSENQLATCTVRASECPGGSFIAEIAASSAERMRAHAAKAFKNAQCKAIVVTECEAL